MKEFLEAVLVAGVWMGVLWFVVWGWGLDCWEMGK